MQRQRMLNNKRFPKIALSVGFTLLCLLVAEAQPIRPDYNPAGRKLPSGVPRTVDTNGVVVYVDPMFTSPTYQEHALDMLIEEANTVARDLQFPETLPIVKANLVGAYVSPFGFAYSYGKIGNITTTNYKYGVAQNFKLSDLTATKLDQRCSEYRTKFQLPNGHIDTTGAYKLATNWLATLKVDVNLLNENCDSHVGLSPHWNGIAKLGDKHKGSTFTPIYYVWWTPKGKTVEDRSIAYVELFLPTKKLLQLTVYEGKYILRKPLAISGLDLLFPSNATITTNYPSAPVILDGLK